MKNKRLNKIAAALGVCCAAAVMGGICMRDTSVAGAANKDPLVEFSMVSGASVRFVNQAQPDGTENGLKYTISMPKGTYTQLMENSSYSDISFGVLIAPESYLTAGHELTEANVFGANAIYDWAIWNGSDWVYDSNSAKVRIMNFESETLPSLSEDGQSVQYSGSIVKLHEMNLDREFRGVGYVKYTQGGTVKYLMTDGEENIRSMTYVAQRAIADPDSKLSGTAKDWLQKNYVDKVTDRPSSYKVEYYLQQKNGEYQLKEWTSISEGITIDDQVSAELKSYLGYEFDESKSVASGKVLANDKLVLKCYYTEKEASATDDLGLVDKNEIGSIDISAYSEYAERSLWTYAGVEADVELSGNALLTEGLNGSYVARFANESEAVELIFDVYDSTATVEWNSVVAGAGKASPSTGNTNVTVVNNDLVPDGADNAGNYYLIETKGAEAFDFRFLPLHSKAYYQQYYGMGIGFAFNYYASVEQSAAANVAIKTTFVGLANSEYWSEVNVGEWHTVSLSLDMLIDHWDTITLEVSGVYCRAEGGIVGGDNACTLAQWYIGGFALAQDLSSIETIRGEDQLIDKKSVGDCSFESLLLSEEEKAIFAAYKGLGEISWMANGVVAADASNVEGYVTVQAILTSGDQSCTLYSAKVDLYNSDDGMVWMTNNTMPLENLVAKSNDSYKLTTSVVTEGYPANAAASTYYRVETAANKSMYTYSVTALHSKAYYEMWQAESALLGKSWSLQFDFTYNTSAYPDSYGNDYYYFRIDGSNTHYYQNKWKTVSITLDRLLYSWDMYASKTAYNIYGSEGPCVMVGTDDNLYYGIDLISYVGNFRSVMTAKTFDESELKLVDLDAYKNGNGTVSCDFANELTAEERATVANYQANGYTISWAVNGNLNPDWDTVEGICTIAAMAEKDGAREVIIVASADIYDSSKDVVWQKNSGLSVDNIKVKQSGSAAITTSVVSENLPKGAVAGEYFYANVAGVRNNYVALSITALHSKAYYEAMLLKYQLLGKTVTIKYDFTHTSTLGVNYLAFYVNGSNDQYYEGVWNTASITLDKMLENWNVYTGNSYNYYPSSPYNMFGADDAAYYGCGWELWVGNFRMEVSSLTVDTANLKLVDLNTYKDGDGTVNCDFANELTAEEQATIASYVADGYTVSWAVNGNTNPNWNTVEGICTIAAVAEKGSEQKVILIAQADIYDSTDGLVWQTNSGLSVDNVAMKSSGLTAEITESAPGGVEGVEYYHVYGDDTKGYYVVSITALHSKAYYQMWLDQATAEGKTYTLQFEFYFNSECYSQLSSGWGYYITMVTGHSNKQFLEKSWQSVSISLENLVKLYDDYGNPAKNDWSSWGHMFTWQDGMATGNHTQENVDVDTYIGNFRVVCA